MPNHRGRGEGSHQELVNVHTSIHSNLTAKIVLELLLTPACGGMVSQQLREALFAMSKQWLRKSTTTRVRIIHSYQSWCPSQQKCFESPCPTLPTPSQHVQLAQLPLHISAHGGPCPTLRNAFPYICDAALCPVNLWPIYGWSLAPPSQSCKMQG